MVQAAPAVAARPAGNDLFRDGPVAQRQPVLHRRAFAQGDDGADEFVARRDRCLTVALAVGVTPQHRRPGVALDVGSADARRVYADDDLARPRLRRGLFFKPVVVGRVADDGAHGAWQGFGSLSGHGSLFLLVL